MTTRKQVAANRRNARKSTGPRTAGGKDRAKGNSLKHGLTAAQITVFDELPEDFENFYSGLLAALVPIGALEEQLVERIAVCAWRLRRVYRIEAWLIGNPSSEAIKASKAAEPEYDLNKLTKKDLISLHALSEAIGAPPVIVEGDTAETATSDEVQWSTATPVEAQGQNDLSIKAQPTGLATSIGAVFMGLASHGPFIQLSRHETTIERSYHRALHDLERLQARRKGEAVIPPVVLNVSSDD